MTLTQTHEGMGTNTHRAYTHTHTRTNRNLRQAFPHMREAVLRKKSGMTVYTTEVRVIFDIFWT